MLRGRQEVWRLPPPGSYRIAGRRVIAEIGRGGMGVVYLAEGDAPDQFVAIKTILPEHRDDSERVTMLADEGQVARRLDHPVIVRVREVAEDHGVPALVLDYVHGESLSSVLLECDRLPVDQAAFVGAQVAAAVASAHELGVIHRDISPHNILIGYDGSVHLTDFGIAWAAEGREAVTEAGVVKGRRAYMPPEQMAGREVTAAADVYALAMTLIRALCGQLPHRDDATGEDVAIPDSVPESLRSLLSAALAPDPGDRVSAGALADSLRALAGDGDSLAELVVETFAQSRALKDEILARGEDLSSAETEVLGPGEPTATTWVRPRPRPLVPAIFAVLTAVLLSVALWWWARGSGESPAVAPVASVSRGPLCVVSGDVERAADRDRTYTATRLVAAALDSVEPSIHGYRDQNRCPDDASRVSVIAAATGGGVAEYGGERVSATGAEPGRIAVELAASIARRRGRPAPSASFPEHDWGRYYRLLRLREIVLLNQSDTSKGAVFEASIREDSELAEPYVLDAFAKWTGGRLSEQTVRRPADASPLVSGLLDAMLAMAGGETGRAVAIVDGLAVDSAPDSLAAAARLIAGEAHFHDGDVVRGAELMAEALSIEPQMLAAIYHVVRYRLARGDWDGATELADRWARVDPSSATPGELRGRVLLGRGEYREALRAYDELLADNAGAAGSEIGRIYALALSGDEPGALAASRAMSELMGMTPSVASVMPEPIGYALSVVGGDEEKLELWSSRAETRLQGEWEENHVALAATMDLIDLLASRPPGGRVRASLPKHTREYRYRDRLGLVALLQDRRPPAGTSPLLTAAAEALAAENQGDLPAAAAAWQRVLDASGEGELDCAALAQLARLAERRGDTAARSAHCERIARPRVPTALCLAARCR